jgi:hypothetical protein
MTIATRAASAALAFLLVLLPLAASAAEITVYKSPYCGCCGAWVDHIKAAGHAVKTVEMEDLTGIKKMTGVPEPLQSCHTAVVGGYVIEGHVPAADVARLLREKPKARGLAVPGMPVGSPGMEGPNPDVYDVLLFQADGTAAVYGRHQGRQAP